ncbi:MAG: hypothetical protein M1823_000168 [Watsoniomyces obsoletus]|nr:MAG: hypothetical protein M1823_000168 [Watsoniomyces obsoletus]
MAYNPEALQILNGLNTAQRMAVSSPAPVLQILAPPGSGKTKTLTARVAYLLRQHGYRPENVIVATFTVKAAKEMKERLSKLLEDGLETKLILGTFHSIARRYLVRYGRLVDVRSGFGIADRNDSVGILKRFIKRRKFVIDPQKALNRISSIKSQGKRGPDSLPGPNYEKKEFAEVYEEYQNTLYRSNLLDYDDLLTKCVELLQKFPHCVRNVEAVLIDEFQDTNIVQFELMKLFATHRKRVTVVGDPDQSIYGFRHAEIKNLERMRNQYPDYQIVLLEENYRSSGAILNSALEVIQQDTNRPDKNLLPTHCTSTRPVLRDFKSAEDEAYWVASEIQRSVAQSGNVLGLNDYAILLRSAFLSRHIESAFGSSGISYRMVGGSRFYDRLEVKIIIDYLRVISQPDNNDALSRIINVPPRRIGEQTVKNLLEEAETKKTTLWSLVKGHGAGVTLNTKVSKPAGNHLGGFVEMIQEAKRKLVGSQDKPHPITTVVEHIMGKIQLEEYLRRAHPEDFENRWANVQELLAQTREFSGLASAYAEDDMLPVIDGLEQQTSEVMEDQLAKFLGNLALSSENTTQADEEGKPKQQVTISTIHAAKGLEWPVVMIIGAYDGSIPHSRAENQDEERRLLYVAMTRAQALLYISYPRMSSWGDSTGLSSFLDCKGMKFMLDKKDPKFEYTTVQSICSIIRRPCPSEVVIAEAIKSFEMGNNKNNSSWRRASDISNNNDVYSTHTLGGRNSCHHDYVPTLKNPGSFSTASTTMSTPGFVSAGTQLWNMNMNPPGGGGIVDGGYTPPTTWSGYANHLKNLTGVPSLSYTQPPAPPTMPTHIPYNNNNNPPRASTSTHPTPLRRYNLPKPNPPKRKREPPTATPTNYHPGNISLPPLKNIKREEQKGGFKVPSDTKNLDSTDLPSVTALLNGSVNRGPTTSFSGGGGGGICPKIEPGLNGEVAVKKEVGGGGGLASTPRMTITGINKGKGKKTLGIRRSQMGWNPQGNNIGVGGGGGSDGVDRKIKRERMD